MELPAEIRAEIEQLLEEEDAKLLSAAAEEISRKYRSNIANISSGKRLVSGRREILAYAAVRMPATFGAVSRALELTLECLPEDTKLDSVMDIGAGTGAAVHAAALTAGCTKFRCVEREPEMTALGRRLTELCGLDAEWISGDITAGIDGSAELVICSYCLNELTPAARKSAVRGLWESAERVLLIVEPGTPEGYANIIAAREQLLTLGAHIAAPCPHEKPCALAEGKSGDWCHFTVRVARSRLHKRLKGGDVPYEDEKFCFLAASREPASPCEGRILRHPRIDSGRITLRLCTPEDIRERVVTRKEPVFKAARKSSAGDIFDNI